MCMLREIIIWGLTLCMLYYADKLVDSYYMRARAAPLPVSSRFTILWHTDSCETDVFEVIAQQLLLCSALQRFAVEVLILWCEANSLASVMVGEMICITEHSVPVGHCHNDD